MWDIIKKDEGLHIRSLKSIRNSTIQLFILLLFMGAIPLSAYVFLPKNGDSSLLVMGTVLISILLGFTVIHFTNLYSRSLYLDRSRHTITLYSELPLFRLLSKPRVLSVDSLAEVELVETTSNRAPLAYIQLQTREGTKIHCLRSVGSSENLEEVLTAMKQAIKQFNYPGV